MASVAHFEPQRRPYLVVEEVQQPEVQMACPPQGS